MRRSTTALTGLVTALMVLTACSSPTDSEPASSSESTTSALVDGSSTDSEQSSDSGSNDPGADSEESTDVESGPDEADVAGVNALELMGPSETETVADMEPMFDGREPQLPATVTDSRGVEVTIESADRILSLDLYGTLTDTLIGLGMQDRLVGRANSDTQEVLADLPVVTQSGHDLNIEAVLNLDPDLVITNTTIGTERLYSQLEAAGITVVYFEQIPSIDNIATEITMVGDALGLTDEATELADATMDRMDEVRAEIDQLKEATPRAPRGAVLYVRGTAGVFFILGADYGAADVLEILGLDDVALNSGITDLRPANAESLISLDPEIILAMKDGIDSTGGVVGLLGRPGMAATTAGSNGRVIVAADTQLLSYGPRTPDNLLALAHAIYTDPDAGETDE
ncbi:heme/hemin ABC transporter substrate-binding protein [Flaviflexus massiliensis]|uniref:heme/hemin ABC transporter substrate-binding protein n=1 Tax=Flaviflexus massiliensis TaxID=1522309 RepID=UPI0006D53B41|nr:ABC transporter substrate-binding protein [Flaviflexus massiliensis]